MDEKEAFALIEDGRLPWMMFVVFQPAKGLAKRKISRDFETRPLLPRHEVDLATD